MLPKGRAYSGRFVHPSVDRRPSLRAFWVKGLGRARVGRRKLVEAPRPSNFIPDRPKAAHLFLFFFLVILDVVCRYLSLFLLYINIKIGKNR